MGKYTTEEIKAFKLKDILNSRMSALKATATNNEGKGKKADAIKKEADEYFKWLRQDQDTDRPNKCPTLGSAPAGTVLEQLPEPTLQQSKILKGIYSRFPGVSEEEIKRATLKWATEIYGVNKYPTKSESVDLFSGWYREKN